MPGQVHTQWRLLNADDADAVQEVTIRPKLLADYTGQDPVCEQMEIFIAAAAERTSRIGLGPGVLIPSLRHPMVNAAGTATLAAMAPGRVAKTVW